MSAEATVAIIIAVIGSLIGIFGFFKSNKKDNNADGEKWGAFSAEMKIRFEYIDRELKEIKSMIDRQSSDIEKIRIDFETKIEKLRDDIEAKIKRVHERLDGKGRATDIRDE